MGAVCCPDEDDASYNPNRRTTGSHSRASSQRYSSSTGTSPTSPPRPPSGFNASLASMDSEFWGGRSLSAAELTDLATLFSQYTSLMHQHGLALQPPMRDSVRGESALDTAARCCLEDAGVEVRQFHHIGGIRDSRTGLVRVCTCPLSDSWKTKFINGSYNPHQHKELWLSKPIVGCVQPLGRSCDLKLRPLELLVSQATAEFRLVADRYLAILSRQFDGERVICPEDLPKYRHSGVILCFHTTVSDNTVVATQMCDRPRQVVTDANLLELVKQINATATKPIRRIPLLPLEPFTRTPCGLHHNSQGGGDEGPGNFSSMEDLSYEFVRFLESKSYDVSALLSLARARSQYD